MVIGHGSIGQRHARILGDLGHDVAVVTRGEHPRAFRSVPEALQQHQPGYVVIANETSLHDQTLAALGEIQATILVEKPLYGAMPEKPSAPAKTYVGYNLRFHPLLARLRELMEGRKIHSVRVTVGQYLPSWRPEIDYRTCYSASAARGGGVLRDLSHELDYILWLCGAWTRLTAISGHFSDLEIDSDDITSILMTTERAPVVSLHLDYLDRRGRREIVITTDEDTIAVDLRAGTLTTAQGIETHATDRDFTYRAQHEALLGGEFDVACTYDEGLRVVEMIAAVEKAARGGVWVNNQP